jgi:hypothetical protein
VLRWEEEEEAGSGKGAHICRWRSSCNDTAKVAVFVDLERKLWESILGLREKGWEGKRLSKTASKGAKTSTLYPRDECFAVEDRPVPTPDSPVTTYRVFIDLMLSDKFLSCT